MPKYENHANGWCCSDCTMLLANGETPAGMTEDKTAEYLARISAIEAREPDGFHVTLGRMFGEGLCDHDGRDDRESEEHARNCEHDEFSWSRCDVCGSNLGGSRDAITFSWPMTDTERVQAEFEAEERARDAAEESAMAAREFEAREIIRVRVGAGDNEPWPKYAWPGGYPLIYVTNDGEILCADCMNAEESSIHYAGDADGWRVDGADIFYEGADEICAGCNAAISSAYGDPEDLSADDEFMNEFVDAYVICALWSSLQDEDEDGNCAPMDDDYGADDIAADSLASMRVDCTDFVQAQSADLKRAAIVRGTSEREYAAQAGHDFWLTRNGHGAGFWDRGLGDIGRVLTDAAHVYGSSDLYVGDDGTVYVS